MFVQLCVSDNSSAGQLFSSSPAGLDAADDDDDDDVDDDPKPIEELGMEICLFNDLFISLQDQKDSFKVISLLKERFFFPGTERSFCRLWKPEGGREKKGTRTRALCRTVLTRALHPQLDRDESRERTSR